MPKHAVARITSLVFALLIVAGCAFFRTPKATVNVADVAAAFPTLERLSAVVYMLDAGSGEEPGCEYFQYGRGAFTSNPDDEFCRVFDFDNRHPGGGDEGPVPIAFDAEARRDLAALKRAFEGVGAPLDYMNAVLAADGSVASDSGFAFDRCVTYWYHPGWTVLPEDIAGDSVSTGINADWYKTDGCP